MPERTAERSKRSEGETRRTRTTRTAPSLATAPLLTAPLSTAPRVGRAIVFTIPGSTALPWVSSGKVGCHCPLGVQTTVGVRLPPWCRQVAHDGATVNVAGAVTAGATTPHHVAGRHVEPQPLHRAALASRAACEIVREKTGCRMVSGGRCVSVQGASMGRPLLIAGH